jgi:hypothetical protein
VPREMFGPFYPSQVDPSDLLHLDHVSLPPDCRFRECTEPPLNSYQLPCMPQLSTADSIRLLPVSPQHRPKVWSPTATSPPSSIAIFYQLYVTVVRTSLGPLSRWRLGPTIVWAPRTTRLGLHSTRRREVQGNQMASTWLGS